VALVDYAEKITTIFTKMESLRTLVRPANREHVDRYLRNTLYMFHALGADMHDHTTLNSYQEKFSRYVELEEKRLSKNLLGVRYFIDGADTLELVTGSGRIEQVCNPSQLISWRSG
jgi:hypothetical protein